VAGFPIPEVLQGINAFTLGMRSVNPQAQVKVIWLNAWFDPPKERDAAMTLMNQEADVLAFHTGSNAVMVAAQERGKMAVAYHSDMRKVAPDAQLLAVTHQWGDYYTQRAKAALAGSWKSGQVWGGIREGMIRVDSFGPRMPAKVVQEINAAQKAIGAGKLRPFSAGQQDVLDNEGKVLIARSTALTDGQILSMNQLVSGVVGKIAK
jgi:basic membrane protein A and related proteins